MSQLNDLKDKALSGQGFQGAVGDKYAQWLVSLGAPAGLAIPDQERAFLAAQGVWIPETQTLNDAWFVYLGSLGYLGDTLQERWFEFWEAGGTIGPPPIPNWDTQPNPPDGFTEVAYNYDLQPHLNTGQQVTITVQSGTLPAGLNIVGLRITGAPTTVETQSNIVLRATNPSGFDDTLPFDISITIGVVRWTSTPTPPSGTVGVAYNYDLAPHLNTVDGVTIVPVSGTPPPGLSIVGTVITGTPTQQGNFDNIVLQATNAFGSDNSAPFTLSVAAGTPTGDITATDPLGLSAGEDINWTVLPPTPPPSGGTRWNPGHYLKVSGNPVQVPQYWDEVRTSLTNNYRAPFIGAHIAVAWGDINPTGSTFDFSDMIAIRDHLLGIDPNAKLIWQLQFKSFRTTVASLEAPADLISDVIMTKSGFISAMWRDNVWPRFVDCGQAIIDQFGSDPSFEILTHTESAASFNPDVAPAPSDYNTGDYASKLKQMWAGMAGAAEGVLNFAAFLNSLGGGCGNNEVPDLMEEIWNLRIMHGGPDAQATYAWENFEGTQLPACTTGGQSPPPARDYRGELGSLNIISQQVLDASRGGQTPAELIDFCQAHQTTHLSWIDYGAHGYTTQDYIDAINADPLLFTNCPRRYLACST